VDPRNNWQRPPPGAPQPAPGSTAPDDVDRLFARLTQLPPPHDLAATVAYAVRAYRPSRSHLAWAAAELVAVLMLGLFGFLAGQTLVGGGALALIGAFATEAGVLRLMPAEALLAVAETLPWIELGAVALAALAVAWCSRRLTRALAGPGQRQPEARGA
jgi:hypothetical protein